MESNVLNLSMAKTDAEFEDEQIVKLLSEVGEEDIICEEKLTTVHHWENIKRHSMGKLLEEVLSVQRLTKKLKKMQKEKSKTSKTNENINDSASDSEDTDNEELNTTEELSNIESRKCDQQNLYNLLKTFITPNAAAATTSQLLNTIKTVQSTSSDASKKRRRSSLLSQSNVTPRTRLMENKRPQLADDDGISAHIVIGPSGTTLTRNAWNTINWTLTGPAITRKILMEVFDRDTLAFHTLTGKPSPAFTEFVMPKKQQLNPEKVSDIIYFMTTYFEMTAREVRSAITTKCADENKMHRQREQKKQKK